VNARYVLLLDPKKRTRELYGRGPELPEAFLEPVGLLNLLTHNENYMTEQDGKPYLISTETVRHEDGSLRAVLLFVNPIDSDFLMSIYGPPAGDRAVALMGDLPLRVIASSNPNIIREGTTAEAMSGRFVASGRSFFDYGTSDLLIQFTSFIPTSEIEALSLTMLNTTRRHRAVTAILLITSFAVILFVITSRIDRLTGRVVDFALNSLGRKAHEIQRGDQLMVLDEEFRNLADGILAYAEELRQTNMDLQKALEDAKAADKAKSEFIQNISHELRTPMSGMIGVTEILLETPQDEEQRNLLSMLHSSSQALLSVINDILDLSSMAEGRTDIQRREFDLTPVVETVTGFFSPEAHGKGLALTSEISHNVPRNLTGDPAHLKQILMYLVGNAIKFTEAGSIKITVEHEKQSGDSTWLRFQVTDTGIGIFEQDLSSIFKPFHQVDGSSTRKYGGTGLGLALASSMVRMMGGTLEVRSEPGKGSTFSFSVPFGVQKT
jgi:signal transduction histidine kinase